MANLLLGYVNYADAATLSGGSWEATLPLSNLQQPRLSRVARSTDATLASTKFDIDMGATPLVVELLGIMGHNMTQVAQFRLTGGATPGATTFDTGWQDVWGAVYGLWDRPFETYDWYSGRITAADAALYPMKGLVPLGSIYLHRYWRVEISDTANPDGYVDLTRLWFGPLWQPTINYDWGAALAWQPRDRALVARSGARFAERLQPQRVFRFVLHELSDQEAFGRVLDLARQLGSEGEVLVIPDIDDFANAHRRNILGRISSYGDGVVDAAYGKQAASITVEERL
jgi:hypothetical protein